jgi:hypothetical protein
MEPTESNALRAEQPRNPYAPPASRLDGPAVVASGGSGGISPLILEHLRLTRPWVKLVAILGFIGSAFLLIAALVMMVFGSAIGLMGPQSADNPLSAAFGAGFGVGIGLVYILLAFLYIAPSLYLLRYARAIQALLANPQVPTLEEALGHQKSFWRFVGICTAVILILYAIFFVFAIGAGIIGAIAASS